MSHQFFSSAILDDERTASMRADRRRITYHHVDMLLVEPFFALYLPHKPVKITLSVLLVFQANKG